MKIRIKRANTSNPAIALDQDLKSTLLGLVPDIRVRLTVYDYLDELRQHAQWHN